MKKLLGIVVLCLLFSKSANADNLPLKLFGIKIYDDAKLYVDLNDGNTSELRPGILSYRHSEEKPFSNLIENSNLDIYRLRTNMLNEVLIVMGLSIFLTLIASIFPAWKASKISPAEALRYE